MKSVLVSAVVALAALALGACYASSMLLLNPDEAAHPLADGIYERDGGDHDRLRVTERMDGWYDVERFNPDGTLGETRQVLFNALPDAGDKAYAVAEQSDEGYVYGVVLVRDERVYLATPDCSDPLDRSLAVDHGGLPEDDDSMTHNCSFRSRDAVLSALADYAGQADFGAPFQKK
jgi:hypothetical protein